MDKEKLLEELKSYSIDDLELIVSTQQDLYSPEEMAVINELISKKRKETEKKQEEYIKSHLPQNITCPKCDGINPFSNEHCSFCGYKLDKRMYYNVDYYKNTDSADNFDNSFNFDEENNEDNNSHAFEYVMSFLVPLVGFILGSILLSKDDPEKKSTGKACIVTALISNVLTVILPVVITLISVTRIFR